jgi:hypothetical protein
VDSNIRRTAKQSKQARNTYACGEVLGGVLLKGLLVVIDQAESSTPTTALTETKCQEGYKRCVAVALTELVAETVKDAELSIRLVGLGKFLGKLGPRHVGTARVDHIHNLQQTNHHMTLWHRCKWYQI